MEHVVGYVVAAVLLVLVAIGAITVSSGVRFCWHRRTGK